MKRGYTDAEFEVISEASKAAPPERKYNGIGIPPEWAVWNWAQRVIFLVLWLSMLAGIALLHHWLWMKFVLDK